MEEKVSNNFNLILERLPEACEITTLKAGQNIDWIIEIFKMYPTKEYLQFIEDKTKE